MKKGFTLIEISIVLVIIGLIVGGILVGRNLIEASSIRSQISQVEKYLTATNTFRTKYNCMPGDCASAVAYGFPARGTLQNEGDGNGLIGGYQGMGETAMFWVDLGMANLIDTQLTVPSASSHPAIFEVTGTELNDYFPQGKLGKSKLYVYCDRQLYRAANPSHGSVDVAGGSCTADFLTIANILGVYGSPAGVLRGIIRANGSLTTIQAYSIDTKMDDGKPNTGTVSNQFLTRIPIVCGGPCDIAASSTTCADNAGSLSNPWQYSINSSLGNAQNCALSVLFQ